MYWLSFSTKLYRIAEYGRCPVYQVIHQVAEELDKNKKKKTRGKTKLVPRFAAGTSKNLKIHTPNCKKK